MNQTDLEFTVPYGTCDTHHHIFNPKEFKITPINPDVSDMPWTNQHPEHPVEEYHRLSAELGITHNIVVATSAYGYNNKSDLDAIEKLGTATTRVITQFAKDVPDDILQYLDKKGVRGSRMAALTDNTVKECLKLAPRFANLGWNLDFCFWGEWKEHDIHVFLDILPQLPCEIVIDHMAGISRLEDPLLPVIKKLLQEKKIWVKISSIFREATTPDFENTVAVSRELVKAAPDRILWASDWPFNWSNFSDIASKDGLKRVVQAIPRQIEDEALREQILVKNPAKLYGFHIRNNQTV